MRDAFIYIASVIQTAILVAMLIVGVEIAADIKEICLTVVQHAK